MLAHDPLTGKPRSVALAILMVLVIGVAWGASFPLNRVVMTASVPVEAYVFLQCAGAAVLLMIPALITGHVPRLGRWRHLRIYLVLSLLGIGIPYYVLAIAADKVPAGVLGLIQTIEPMMTYVLVLAFALERFNWMRIGGLAFGLAGVLLILVPRASLPEPGMALWIAIGFSVSVCWAFWAVAVVLLRPPLVHPLAFATGYALCNALITFPAVVVRGGWWFFDGAFGPEHGSILAMMAINGLLFYLSLECIRYAGAVVYSLWAYVGTLTAIGLGILLFDERHSAFIWAAVVLLTLGMTLVTQAGNKHASPAAAGQ